MSPLTSFVSSITKRAPLEQRRVQVELGKIDQSMRAPTLLFLISGLLWLILGTVFALVASFSLHSPDLLPNWEWLTFGRMRSAHLNAVAYGWLNNAVFAVALWIMARLSRCEIKNTALLFIAGCFWNIGITIGIIGILNGHMTSVEWLEMPSRLAPLLAFSYILIGIWGLLSFRYRRTSHVYVSQWYIAGALFWFPAIYLVAQTMILHIPARGTVQAITNWWFAHNALGLWYTPVSIATVYYLIPKVLGRPIHSYYLSVLGFWSLALFYNWAGVHHLIGGPIPVWLQSVGIVASIFMVIPVVVTGINHHLTVVGNFKRVWASPTLRFAVFGAMMYTFSSLVGSTMALREINLVTHFTHFTVGHAHHGAYGFVSMVMFGSIYFMMPRLLKKEWPSAFLIRLHFWAAALGISIMIIALHVGGWIQGLEMNDGEIPFMDVVRNTVPWLKARSVSGTFLAIGHLALFSNFLWMVMKPKQARNAGPTVIGDLNKQGGTA